MTQCKRHGQGWTDVPLMGLSRVSVAVWSAGPLSVTDGQCLRRLHVYTRHPATYFLTDNQGSAHTCSSKHMCKHVWGHTVCGGPTLETAHASQQETAHASRSGSVPSHSVQQWERARCVYRQQHRDSLQTQCWEKEARRESTFPIISLIPSSTTSKINLGCQKLGGAGIRLNEFITCPIINIQFWVTFALVKNDHHGISSGKANNEIVKTKLLPKI